MERQGVCEVPGNEVASDKELELIAERLNIVKQAGHGEIVVRVTGGKVVYITHTIGEQIKSK